MPSLSRPALTLEPIGVLHCAQLTRVEAPRQPAAADQLTGVIELLPGHNFEHALEDLAGWERIWVIFWFHQNAGWRPKVLPPRSRSGRKGVFSTRAPHRPNPLGLSALRLGKIDGLRLTVHGVDLLDGTPVLDIKPYVAYTDAWPDARSGWLVDQPARGAGPGRDPAARYEVDFDPRATAQLDWIAARSPLPLRQRILATLALGPQPHPYRRIRREGEGFRLAVQDWRVRFTVGNGSVHVLDVSTGYRDSQLERQTGVPGGALALHRDYVAAWGKPR
jgi:tRNA-Thr(GGU) m(6)t(6)A37 methyltransferase TsaA